MCSVSSETCTATGRAPAVWLRPYSKKSWRRVHSTTERMKEFCTSRVQELESAAGAKAQRRTQLEEELKRRTEELEGSLLHAVTALV